jgi:hypothetical protein
MGVVEDVRQVIQDFVSPDQKATLVRVEIIDKKLDSVQSRLDAYDSTMQALRMQMDQILLALNIDRRLLKIEQEMQMQKDLKRSDTQ